MEQQDVSNTHRTTGLLTICQIFMHCKAQLTAQPPLTHIVCTLKNIFRFKFRCLILTGARASHEWVLVH
jgi:hypothetical protein